MDVLMREVPEQTVVTEQRMVDQAALGSWLPGAMSRVLQVVGVPAPADVASRVIPAHREAYARVTKGVVEWGHIGDVYVAIEQWIGTNGMEIAAAPRETYWTDFYAAGGTDVVFDVAFPVR
jgi:hypothetical protein